MFCVEKNLLNKNIEKKLYNEEGMYELELQTLEYCGKVVPLFFISGTFLTLEEVPDLCGWR